MSYITPQNDVYRSTEISDLLSSPIFYAVLALTFILGVSSIFGFLQNPRKLKTVVDVISEKVLLSQDNVNNHFASDPYSLSHSFSKKKIKIAEENNRYNILSSQFLTPRLEIMSKGATQRVSFNYDITSNHFWENLDTSRIESAQEESLRKDAEALVIGIPLSQDYYAEEGDSKYLMKAGLLQL